MNTVIITSTLNFLPLYRYISKPCSARNIYIVHNYAIFTKATLTFSVMMSQNGDPYLGYSNIIKYRIIWTIMKIDGLRNQEER